MKSTPAKILIVEDEPVIASDIEMALEEIGYNVTDVVDNAKDAISSILKNKPNLILLDINLEDEVDGITLAHQINENYQIPFIFLTSNADENTINRVKRTSPKGFILKPFNDKDLKSNIEIALFTNEHKEKTISRNSDDFFVKSGNGLVRVNFSDLIFAKAEDNYTRLFTTQKNFVLSSTLKTITEKLPSQNFIRIHRSYVINPLFIDKIKDGYVYIKNHQLPIGRSYHDALYDRINKL